MVHVDYNVPLVLFSVFVAIIASYLAISVEHIIFKPNNKKQEKIMLVVGGLILGLAIWLMHLIGMIACNLPEGYFFDKDLHIISYFIAAFTSIFALWLNTRSPLPTSYLIISSILMGLGIAGMHYTGMMGLIISDYHILYDPLMILISVLLAIFGSGLSFLLFNKSKNTLKYKHFFRIATASVMGISIVGMHYTGMAAIKFSHISNTQYDFIAANSTILLFTIIFMSVLFLVVVFFVTRLESNLTEKNKALIKLNRDINHLSEQDHLTQLPNRFFLEHYADKILLSHQHHRHEIAFLYIDLDRFKVINDVFGHCIGDKLLIEVTKRMKHSLSHASNLIRLGGDEFLLIIEHSSLEQAVHTAEKIIYAIQKEYEISGQEFHLSASIGISIYPLHGCNFNDLLTNADMAMYLAKENGRNTYRIFNDLLEEKKAKNKFQISNDLNKAIEDEQLVLHYQPKFTANEKICGVEALIRWQHPKHGLLGPQVFIDIAERTGIIIPIGYWVIEQACQQIKIWEENGQMFYPIAINLSALQFEHNMLFFNLESLLNKYNIQPNHLIIEVTETTAMRNIELCVQTFQRLRDMGIQIAIDDFGTGYSSFSYLKDLPLDELKIDKVFIVNLTENSKEEKILASIIQLSTQLGLIVTAEGVETQEQAMILKRLGCHQLQGFLYGKPMPVENLGQYQHQLI